MCAGTVLATEGTKMDKTRPLASGGSVIQQQTCPQKLPIWSDMISREGDALTGWTGMGPNWGAQGSLTGQTVLDPSLQGVDKVVRGSGS